MTRPLLRPILLIANALCALARSTRASAAVEFAIVVPVGLLIYVGVAQVSDAVMASRKATLVTRTLIDLAAQETATPYISSSKNAPSPIAASEIENLFNAATMIMTPQPTAPLSLTLTAYDITQGSNGICCAVQVRWSYTRNGALRPCNASASTIPTSMLPYGYPLPQPISYLVAEIGYTYQAVFQTAPYKFAPTMNRIEYMSPRAPGQIYLQGTMPSSGATQGKICY